MGSLYGSFSDGFCCHTICIFPPNFQVNSFGGGTGANIGGGPAVPSAIAVSVSSRASSSLQVSSPSLSQ